MDAWLSLPAFWQDFIIAMGLLTPAIFIGFITLRGYAPSALVAAILWRFRWANAMFIMLIAISVGMGVGLLSQERGLRQGTAQAAEKFDLIVAAPGSEITMMLASVFLQPSDVPLLGGEIYNEVATHDNVQIAAPLAFGDSYGGVPVVGTTADFARYLSTNRIEGRMWQTSGEAIIGAFVSLDIGEAFTPVHGVGDAAGEVHYGPGIRVVGKMNATGTPWDRSILVPVETVWEIHGLANGHAPERGDQIGPPFDEEYFPGTPAIIVRAEALWANYSLRSEFTRDADTMAFFPGAVLANLYRVMGDVRQAMSIMALFTQGLVAMSVVLGLFMLTRLFRRQISLLRALGAPTRFIFAVVWSYAALLLAVGTVIGLGFGFIAAAILSKIITAQTDILVEASLSWAEFHLVAGFLSVASLLSMLPAAIVLKQPMVDGLRA